MDPRIRYTNNDLTTFCYAKDYDAVVTVKCEDTDCRFALEYERSVKTKSKYEEICSFLHTECHVNTVLYLSPTYHVLSFMKRCFAPKRQIICLAVATDFLEQLLDTSVIVAGRIGGPIAFKDVLVRMREGRSGGTTRKHFAEQLKFF